MADNTLTTSSRLPDFYLASSEGYGLQSPRACFAIRRLTGPHPDGYLLCGIEPPIIGQGYGLGGRDIDQIVIAARHEGRSLFPISEWPLYVHVFRPLAELADGHEIEKTDVESIAWAALYKALSDFEGGASTKGKSN